MRCVYVTNMWYINEPINNFKLLNIIILQFIANFALNLNMLYQHKL